MSTYHAHDGWFFHRKDDGTVVVTHEGTQVEFDAATWASIVAAVSLAGEHGDTFHLADWMHNAMPDSWVRHKKAVDQIVAG